MTLKMISYHTAYLDDDDDDLHDEYCIIHEEYNGDTFPPFIIMTYDGNSLGG